jgi:ankyrin repeat protein
MKLKIGLFLMILAFVVPSLTFAQGLDAKTKAFFDLVKTGTAKQVAAAVKGVDLTITEDTDNKTPLLWAASYNPDPAVIAVLIKAGADPTDVDKESSTILMDTACDNNLDVLTAVFKLDNDVKAKDNNGRTALHFAAGWNPRLEVTKFLIAKGSDLEAVEKKAGATPLMYAAGYNRNPKITQALLDAGADMEATSNDGSTPLLFAASFNSNPDVLNVLKKAGAQFDAVNNAGDTALILAAGNGNAPEVISALIADGADVNARDKDQITALLYTAALSKHIEVIGILLKAGADINARDKDGNTALIYAAGVGDSPDMVEGLLKAGADPTIKNNIGSTALDFADAGAAIGRTNVKDSQAYQDLLAVTPQAGMLSVDNETAYTITIQVDGNAMGTTATPWTVTNIGSIPAGTHTLHGTYLPDPVSGNWGPRTITMDRSGYKWTLTAQTVTVTNDSNTTINIYLDNQYIGVVAAGNRMIYNVAVAGAHTLFGRGYNNQTWGPTSFNLKENDNYYWHPVAGN